MFSDLYLHPGEILLPREGVELSKWACLACDQFTSQPAYWREADAFVGDSPSMLRLIIPECELPSAPARTPKVLAAMRRYAQDGTLAPAVQRGFILTERNTGRGARVGLVGLLDLESYDFRKGSESPVRATEETILARIPPRLTIRRDAALETSHVLMLMDDPLQSVVEPLYDRRDTLEKLYDFPLMLEGGHLTGYAVTDESDLAAIAAALTALKARMAGEHPLLYAVGDGNHSLATAKTVWEELKPSLTPAQQASHPARFALVELENIHDDALRFEPIHRVLFGYDGDTLLDEWERFAIARGGSLAELPTGHEVTVVFEGKQVTLGMSGAPDELAARLVDDFLDAWLPGHPGAHVDYVHGEAAVRALVGGERAVGFLLPALDKDSLFDVVRRDGALPRKTFSLGEAREKRYYMETRRLFSC